MLASLANRALHCRDKDTVQKQEQEQRPKSYRDELAALIEDVAGERVTSGDRVVTVWPMPLDRFGSSPDSESDLNLKTNFLGLFEPLSK